LEILLAAYLKFWRKRFFRLDLSRHSHKSRYSKVVRCQSAHSKITVWPLSLSLIFLSLVGRRNLYISIWKKKVIPFIGLLFLSNLAHCMWKSFESWRVNFACHEWFFFSQIIVVLWMFPWWYLWIYVLFWRQFPIEFG